MKMKLRDIIAKFGENPSEDLMLEIMDYDVFQQKHVFEEPCYIRQFKGWGYCDDPLDWRYQFFLKYWNRTVQYLSMSVVDGRPVLQVMLDYDE